MDDSSLVGNDLALLCAARTDPEAFGEVYGRHAAAVERWIRVRTPDMATAADLTAETFAQALVSGNDGLHWPRRDGLKWPHLASVVCVVDVA